MLFRSDASTVSQGSLITATVKAVAADRPVLLSGGAVRAYVGTAPAGKTVDGWFGDWGPDLQNDTDPARVEPDRDLDRSSSNRTGTTLFLYADVKGTLLGGAPIPVRRTRWEPGSGPSSTAPQFPIRNAGTDVLRVYIDTNSAVAAGLAIHGLRGADLLLEVDGIHGLITKRAAFSNRGFRSRALRSSCPSSPGRRTCSGRPSPFRRGLQGGLMRWP